MVTLKLGSKNEDVKHIQLYLGLTADGNFGPKTEAAVKQWQAAHGLVADGIVGVKTWVKMFGEEEKGESELNIIKAPINVHITRSPGRPITYLVIHYTAGSRSTKGKAMAARNVFISRPASADYCVDDETIVQVNPDLRNYYCWAVGDGKGKRGMTNKNCISIEMCSSLDKGTTKDVPNHPGWHISDAVIEKTVKLAKYLMGKYNITLDRVVRHYDASGKACPGVIGWNDGQLYDPVTGKVTGKKNNSSEWEKFKSLLQTQ